MSSVRKQKYDLGELVVPTLSLVHLPIIFATADNGFYYVAKIFIYNFSFFTITSNRRGFKKELVFMMLTVFFKESVILLKYKSNKCYEGVFHIPNCNNS